MLERVYDRCEAPAHSFKSLWKSDYERMTGTRVLALWTAPLSHRLSRHYVPSRKLRGLRKHHRVALLDRLRAIDSDALKPLEDAVKVQNETAFNMALEAINWQNRPVVDYVRAIRLGFEVGAYLAARQISERAIHAYPNAPELQRLARVLAPPRLISSTLPRDETGNANRKWLQDHSGEYKGRWVAVKRGELLGVADTLPELTANLGNTADVLLTVAP